MIANMSPNTLGALLMVCSMFCFTVSDAAIKFTGGAVPLAQLLTIRTAMTAVLILALAVAMKRLHFRMTRRDRALILVRCIAEVAAAYFFITALFNMPLANITAILQVIPLTVTLCAALFFGDRVGWRRMTAIIIGFIGVMLILRPGPDGFSRDAIYVLATVGCVTVRDLVTRRLSAQVSTLSVTFLTSCAIFASAGAASLMQEWVPVEPLHMKLIVLSAVVIAAAYFFSIQVMRVGEVSFVAPFRYTGLLWATLLGWVVFGHWPAPLTFLGAAIVVGSGLFMLRRNRIQQKAP